MNTTARIFILIASLLQLAPMTLMSQGQVSKQVDDAESYAVYKALLPSEELVLMAHAKTLVFQQETTIHQRCMPSEAEMSPTWQPVVKDFRTINATPKFMLQGFDLGMPYMVATSEKIQAAFVSISNDPWGGFFKRYPDSGGYMVVSAVAFDGLKKRALAYIAHYCGLLCGGGTYHFLEKIDGVWRETKFHGMRVCSWVS